MEPALLAAGEAAGAQHDVLLGLGPIQPATEEVDHLGVAQGPAGGAPSRRPWASRCRTSSERGPRRTSDPRAPGSGRPGRRVARSRPTLRCGTSVGPSAGNCAVNGSPVISPTSRARTIRRPLRGQDVRGSLGIPCREDGVELGRADLSQRRLPSCPDLRIAAGEPEVVEQGAHVEPRPADDHRGDSPVRELPEDGTAGTLVLRDAESPRLRQGCPRGDAAIPRRSAGGHLGRADVHAAGTPGTHRR